MVSNNTYKMNTEIEELNQLIQSTEDPELVAAFERFRLLADRMLLGGPEGDAMADAMAQAMADMAPAPAPAVAAPAVAETAPAPAKKKDPTEYQTFVKDMTAELKKTQPGLSGAERKAAVAAAWKDYKSCAKASLAA